MTSIYGGIAFYGRFTLGRQRLSALGVDLKHLKTIVAVLATAFLIDKVIRLHKRKDEIAVITLWRDLPFDQDMDKDFVAELQTQVAELKAQVDNDKDVVAELKAQNAEMKTKLDNSTLLVKDVDTLIIAKIDRLFTELQARGDPLSLDNLALFVRAHVQAGDTIVPQLAEGSSVNDNASHPAGVPSLNAVVAPGLLLPPTICLPLNAVAVHESRHAPVLAPREGRTRSPSPSAHTGQSTMSRSCAMLKLMCSLVMVILF